MKPPKLLLACSQFHKTCFGVIYAAIGILPKILTQVLLLGVYITAKNVFETDT
jgi:hypothetical protein